MPGTELGPLEKQQVLLTALVQSNHVFKYHSILGFLSCWPLWFLCPFDSSHDLLCRVLFTSVSSGLLLVLSFVALFNTYILIFIITIFLTCFSLVLF